MELNNECTLLMGDCLERMKEIPDGSVDAVITDMPYGINFASWDVLHKNTNKSLLGSSRAQKGSKLFGTRGKPKNGWSSDDKLIARQFQDFTENFVSECLRVVKEASPIIVFTGRQYCHRFICGAEDVGAVHKDTLSWDKGMAAFRAQNVNKVLERRGEPLQDGEWRLGNLAPRIEPIVWCFKPYKIGSTLTDRFIEDKVGCFSSHKYKSNLIQSSSRLFTEKLHETQKPVNLMEDLVEMFTVRGHTVLDPFMGSGTTGIACKNLNRDFIGIEKDEGYFNIAQDRISAT